MNEPLFKTLSELIQWYSKYLPYASVGEDNDGQLVIYTNLYETDEHLLADFNDPNDEGFWMEQDGRALPTTS